MGSSMARRQASPCDDERVEEKVSVFCQECKEGGNAVCAVEVLRVPDATRIEVHNHRRFPYNPVDSIEREPAWLARARPGYASGDGKDVHGGVGRLSFSLTRYTLQHDHCLHHPTQLITAAPIDDRANLDGKW